MATTPATELRLDAVLDWMRHPATTDVGDALELLAAIDAADPMAERLDRLRDKNAELGRRYSERDVALARCEKANRNLIAERDRLAAEVAALKAAAPLLPEPADPDAAAVEAMADAIREAGHAAPPRTPLDSKLLARAALAAYRKLIDGEAH